MSVTTIKHHNFDTADAFLSDLTDHIAVELSLAIVERGSAVLAVSVGAMAEELFDRLSKLDIAWEQVTVTVVDERFVPIEDARSHEGLVRRCLIQNNARKARFVGLYMTALTAELSAFSAANRINNLPKPFDVVVLDLGEGGQIAALLPAGDRLKQAMDRNSRALVVPMHAKGAGEARLTMTMPLLASARFVALYVEGERKRKRFEADLADETKSDTPVCALLSWIQNPVHVFYAPQMTPVTQAQVEEDDEPVADEEEVTLAETTDEDASTTQDAAFQEQTGSALIG